MATAVSGADAPKGPGRLASAIAEAVGPAVAAALVAHDKGRTEAAERAEFQAWKDGKAKTIDVRLGVSKEPVDKHSSNNGWVIAGLVIAGFVLLAIFLPRMGTNPQTPQQTQSQPTIPQSVNRNTANMDGGALEITSDPCRLSNGSMGLVAKVKATGEMRCVIKN